MSHYLVEYSLSLCRVYLGEVCTLDEWRRVHCVLVELEMSGVAAGPGRAAQQREVAGGNSRVIPHCGKRPNPVATGLLAGYFPFSLF